MHTKLAIAIVAVVVSIIVTGIAIALNVFMFRSAGSAGSINMNKLVYDVSKGIEKIERLNPTSREVIIWRKRETKLNIPERSPLAEESKGIVIHSRCTYNILRDLVSVRLTNNLNKTIYIKELRVIEKDTGVVVCKRVFSEPVAFNVSESLTLNVSRCVLMKAGTYIVDVVTVQGRVIPTTCIMVLMP